MFKKNHAFLNFVVIHLREFDKSLVEKICKKLRDWKKNVKLFKEILEFGKERVNLDNIYLFKFNKRNIRKRCEKFSKLTNIFHNFF